MTQVVQKIKEKEETRLEELNEELWFMIEDLEKEEKLINRKKSAIAKVHIYLRDEQLAQNHRNMLGNLKSSIWNAKSSDKLDFFLEQFRNLTQEIEDAKEKGHYNY